MTFRFLSDDGPGGAAWLSGSGGVDGLHPELILLPLLQVGHHKLRVLDGEAPRGGGGPVAPLGLSLDDVAEDLAPPVVRRFVPREGDRVGGHVAHCRGARGSSGDWMTKNGLKCSLFP